MIDIVDYWTKKRQPVVMSVMADPSYRQLPDMVEGAVTAIKRHQEISCNIPPALFPDYGTVTTARPWGGKVTRNDFNQPFIHPISGDLDEVLAVEPGQHADIDWTAELYDEVRRRTGLADLAVKLNDFQGVLNTAAMILKQDEMFVAMHTEPEKMHTLLDRVCSHNILYAQQFLKRMGRFDGMIWPYIWVPHQVGVMLTEDLMPLISPEMFRDFGLPYLKRISDTFGGVFIHCCGSWGQHARTLAGSGVKILGMEFCHPFTTIERIQEYLDDLVLVPALNGFGDIGFANYVEFLKHLLAVRKPNVRLWIPCVESSGKQIDEIRAVLESEGFDQDEFVMGKGG